MLFGCVCLIVCCLRSLSRWPQYLCFWVPDVGKGGNGGLVYYLCLGSVYFVLFTYYLCFSFLYEGYDQKGFLANYLCLSYCPWDDIKMRSPTYYLCCSFCLFNLFLVQFFSLNTYTSVLGRGLRLNAVSHQLPVLDFCI